jgi:hypothetical protein
MNQKEKHPEEKKSAIPVSEANCKAKNKTEQYNAMLLNDYYLMASTCSGCTREYMDKVRSGKYWVPRWTALKMRPCPYAPTKEHFFSEVLKILTTHKLVFGVKSHACCDLDWLKACLATLNPEHRYFQKDYLPSVEESRYVKKKPNKSGMVDNADGFYTGLPKLHAPPSARHPRAAAGPTSTRANNPGGFVLGAGPSTMLARTPVSQANDQDHFGTSSVNITSASTNITMTP